MTLESYFNFRRPTGVSGILRVRHLWPTSAIAQSLLPIFRRPYKRLLQRKRGCRERKVSSMRFCGMKKSRRLVAAGTSSLM
jgi:hypothetical protein